MGKRSWLALGLIVAIAAGGCGGGSADPSKEDTVDWSIYPPGPTRQFIIPGGDNAVQIFGDEGTAAERKAASRVINAWLHARKAKNWAKDCSYFTSYYAKTLTADAHDVSDGKVNNCAEALAYFGKYASGAGHDTLDGVVDSLRVDTNAAGHTAAYAQWHGTDGNDYVVPMDKEGGTWKISHSRPFNRLE